MENYDFVPVESSMLKEAAFDRSTDSIIIKFKNDSVYSYKEASEELFNKLLEAESIGKFFIANIKILPFEKIS
jgi:hypothetical protein